VASFTVPEFNMAYEWWAVTNPTTNPPDLTGLCQLYYYSRATGTTPFHTAPGQQLPMAAVRVDKGWYQMVFSPQVNSIFKIPDTFGINWYYIVKFWDQIHLGFPNEYTELLCVQCESNGLIPDGNR